MDQGKAKSLAWQRPMSRAIHICGQITPLRRPDIEASWFQVVYNDGGRASDGRLFVGVHQDTLDAYYVSRKNEA